MIKELHDEQDLDELLKLSHRDPVLLFKHSTQCSRSAAAFEDLEAFDRNNPAVHCGLILVIEDRTLSDEVEERFGIRHESPQAIWIVNETPVWQASHWKITVEALESALRGTHAKPIDS